MEIRRLEGTFLEDNVEKARSQEIKNFSQQISIQIQNSVSSAFLSSLFEGGLGGQGNYQENFLGRTINGYVESIDKENNKISIAFENGYVLEAPSSLSISLKEGDLVKFLLDSLNPITLKILEVKEENPPLKEVFKVLKNEENPIINIDLSLEKFQKDLNALKEDIKNSGIFFEKNLIDAISLKDIKLLEQDSRYLILKDIFANLKDLLSSKSLDSKAVEYFSKSLENLSIEPSEFKSLLENIKNSINTVKLDYLLPIVEDNIKSLSSLNIFEDRSFKESIFNVLSSLLKEPALSLNFKEKLVNLLDIQKLLEKEPFFKEFNKFDIKSLDPQQRQKFLENVMNFLTTKEKNSVLNYIKTYSESFNTLSEITKDLKTIADFIKDIDKTKLYISNIDNRMNELNSILSLSNFVIKQKDGILIPFKGKEKKGSLGFFLKENSYKIFAKISWEDSFLGILMIAPKVKNPSFVSIKFSSNDEKIISSIKDNEELLKEELREIGITLNNLETHLSDENEFNSDIAKEISISNAGLNFFA